MPSFYVNVRDTFFREPPVQTTSFANRTVIITGANTGLGFAACELLIPLHVFKIILAVRSSQKGHDAVKTLRAQFPTSNVRLQVEKLDMGSHKSCLEFTDRMKLEPRLDALILNAGIWPVIFKMTEGNEESITTNVISTALLAFLLHPLLSTSARRYDCNTHITIVSSTLSATAKFKESRVAEGEIFKTLNDEKTSDLGDRYQVTKLLEIFIVRILANLSPFERSGVIVNANAPGYVNPPPPFPFRVPPHSTDHYSSFCRFTNSSLQLEKQNAIINFLSNHIARKVEVGARTLVFGASAPAETHGRFVPDCEIREVYGMGWGVEGEKLQARVWDELRVILEGIKKGVCEV